MVQQIPTGIEPIDALFIATGEKGIPQSSVIAISQEDFDDATRYILFNLIDNFLRNNYVCIYITYNKILLGVKVSHVAVYKWIQKYTELMKQYVDKLKPNVGDTWRADEVFVKFSGDMKYLFALMDDETRYWIAQEVADTKFKHDAQNLFHEGKEIAGKRPNTLITDGLPAYHDAFNKEFYTNKLPQSKHINAIKLDGNMNYNK